MGDMVDNNVEVAEPHWCPGADLDKTASVRSRIAMLNQFDSEGNLVAAGHYHTDEYFGRIVRLKGRRY